MKNNEAYKRIESHDQYPSGFSSNVKTQRKLIEDSVRAVEKKPIIYFSKPYRVVAASALLIALSISGYFMLKTDTNRTKYFVKTEKIKSENPTEKQSDVIQTPIIKTNQYNSKSQQFDTTQIQVDTLKTHIYESAIIAFQSDTLVPQKEKPVIAEQHFFAKKQRIKEFNFEARTIAPASKKQKNMEFFVLKDGQFKILSKNKMKQHIIQYE
jgi:uncharacterized protein YxeA